jgi:hypothetical protein
MITFVDSAPPVAVDTAEFRRLLGYPAGHQPSPRGLELEQWAREWFSQNGRPWMVAWPATPVEISTGVVTLAGETFTGIRLSGALSRAAAHGAWVVAVCAGAEAETEAGRRWREEKPDEYFFLESYASAVVEHLVVAAGARLCAWAERAGVAVLPHDSPGYSGWDVAEQGRLLGLCERLAGGALPGPLEALHSGALRPKKSQLAVFGVTRDLGRIARLNELNPCHGCSLAGCAFRRVPYSRGVSRRLLATLETGTTRKKTGGVE